jgi:hypothetical protein
MSASSLSKDYVRNRKNEELGSIKDIMIDVPSGTIAYAVLSVGGFLGMGDRLFAIPWQALMLDEDEQCFVMDVDKDRLDRAPGFDKSNWPDMANPTWRDRVSTYWTGLSSPGSMASADDYGVTAARRYDRQTAGTSEKEIDRKAQEAREAIDGPEGYDLRRAEAAGKEPLKR